jgi:hypothetical protein
MNDREFRQLVTAMRIAQRRLRDWKARHAGHVKVSEEQKERKTRLREEAGRLTREVDAVIGLLPFEGKKTRSANS